MKKLLSILAAVGLTATASSSVVACTSVKKVSVTIDKADLSDNAKMMDDLNSAYNFRKTNDKAADKAKLDSNKVDQEEASKIVIPLFKIGDSYSFANFSSIDRTKPSTVNVVMVKVIDIIDLLNGSDGVTLRKATGSNVNFQGVRSTDPDDAGAAMVVRTLTSSDSINVLDLTKEPEVKNKKSVLADTPNPDEQNKWYDANVQLINKMLNTKTTGNNVKQENFDSAMKSFNKSLSELKGQKVKLTINFK